ncbi:hypothetical protein C8A05DRAFT_11237 [Staphylotrichum tortipilum]|uniref:Abscission/NoCut checkpoint regulator n=1 Tax=Staphylotrichum tortipilum TaxID=2831512 RepID=A0AAN6MTW3_9PEZI|nr:hypothetical protein C8A05DRAFT_11219 [Staphylotrichum longicolle]KAK3907063.1 hypothetical protein C8A05DRAFT_11237 [Staphylotrichum longicolle]
MPRSRPADQALLDRLNALKSTPVALDQPTNTTDPPLAPDGPEAQPPVSREDALASRLRSLRHQLGRPQQPAPPPAFASGGFGATTPPSIAQSPGDRSPGDREPGEAPWASPGISENPRQKPPPYGFADSTADDEAALDALLEALGDEEFDMAAEDDVVPPPEFDPHDEAEKVAGLLDSLQPPSGRETSKQGVSPSEDDDDDSDGEQMNRAVEALLSQIGDEINSLPPPTAAVPGDDGETEDPLFALPTVPSQLVDPVPDARPEDDFEKDISARLASLRGLGALDALGMPSAPTFQPQDNNPTLGSGKGLLRSNKYTDEDQKTWCVVCLEDATIRCVGCDNDVYCGRCWKEMHVGRSAGYDERGHQWVKFQRTTGP